MDHGRNGSLDGRGDLGVQEHCQRVAAWSGELASALGLLRSERSWVEQAARCHHVSEIALEKESRHRLLEDLKIEETGVRDALPEEVAQLLRTFWGNEAVSDPSIAKLAAVLEICDDFDQFFEAEPLGEVEMADQPNPSV